MKKFIKYTGIAFLAASFLTACTGAFEDMNTNPKGVTDEELKQDGNYIGAHFVPMMKSVYYNTSGGNWEFQLTQNLHADMFSGYMSSINPFNGNVNNMTYSMNAGWNDYCWDYAYNTVMSECLKAQKKCAEDPDTYAHFNAISTIIRVLAMSRTADQYGCIIYSEYGKSATGGKYDAGDVVYKAFFKELKEAADVLRDALTKSVVGFGAFDLAYGGDLAKWAKLCNSLRLRLAMRVVKFDAVWAQTEAEAAMSDSNGLIETNDGNLKFSGKGYTNPLTTLVAWGDCSLNANMTSILGGMNDARLKLMANEIDGKVVGFRTGVDIPGGFKDVAFGKVSSPATKIDETIPLVTASETLLLEAEAALRGWNVNGKGTAKSLYERGVQTSFKQWGAVIGNYLEGETPATDHNDNLLPTASTKAVSKVTAKWNDALSNEEKFAKIATQRWIAIFPEGINGWADYRRTGYPKLFKNDVNYSQGEIDTDLGPRRLPFTLAEKTTNPDYADAVSKLGGPDNAGTRVFWDIDKPNF